MDTRVLGGWVNGAGCPCCEGVIATVAVMPFPHFAHRDFGIAAPGPIPLLGCARCGMAGIEAAVPQSSLAELYSSETYVAFDRPIQMVRPPNGGDPVKVFEYQADLMATFLPSSPRILDVGCFDGHLLRHWRSRSPTARLVGYDVGPLNARYFSPESKIEYAYGSLETVEGEFDVIVMSHSLQYQPDLGGLFGQLDRLLAQHGSLFIQVPDVERKPTALLFGDLFHHFSTIGLRNMLASFGFQSQDFGLTAFPRDILLRARRGKPALQDDPLVPIRTAVEALAVLARSVTKLRDGKGWNILGTTIDASFVASLLGSEVTSFLDEAPGPGAFFGLPVRHPDTLGADDRTLIPLGPTRLEVLERFRSSYSGSFELV